MLTSIRLKHRLAGPAAVLLSLIAFAASPIAAQSASPPERSGRTIFESQCARCHGIDGRGGQGPSLRRPFLRRAPDDSALAELIASGIPERGMPAAWQLAPGERTQLASYVRSFGRTTAVPLPGDSARGAALTESRGGCLACHVISGRGGILGPELTAVGSARGAEYLRRALLTPGAEQSTAPAPGYGYGEYAQYLTVSVQLHSGIRITGVRIAEDAFTIQLRDVGGKLHSIDKSAARAIEKRPDVSLMPSYADRFAADELDDLVAFLAALRGTP